MPYKTSSTERDTWLFVVANEKQAGGIDVSDALTTKAEEIQEMLNEAYMMTKELEAEIRSDQRESGKLAASDTLYFSLGGNGKDWKLDWKVCDKVNTPDPTTAIHPSKRATAKKPAPDLNAGVLRMKKRMSAVKARKTS